MAPSDKHSVDDNGNGRGNGHGNGTGGDDIVARLDRLEQLIREGFTKVAERFDIVDKRFDNIVSTMSAAFRKLEERVGALEKK